MQHLHDTGFEPGTIVVPAHFQSRWYEFSMSLESLQVPHGTRLALARSCDIAFNCNQGVRRMEGSWCWFMGDDHEFDADMLLKLLSLRKRVVLPIVTAKIAPFRPCIMHGPYKVGMPVYFWHELPTGGLYALPKGDFVGQAGMLVQRDVLMKMGDPWFMPGQLEKDRLQEDLYFCQRLQDQGETIYVDCNQVLRHIGHIVAGAVRTEKGWVPSIQSGNRSLALPGLLGAQPEAYPHLDTRNGAGRPTLQWVSAA